MTNEEMTQHPAPPKTEENPVSDENPTLHGSVATEAPFTQEIPDTPQPAQVTPSRRADPAGEDWLSPHVAMADGLSGRAARSRLIGRDLFDHHDRQRRGTGRSDG